MKSCKQNGNDLSVSIYVQPKARKSEIVGFHGDELKVKIAAPPVDGEANEEVIDFFSKFLKMPKRNIQIKSGDQSRHKIISIANYTVADWTTLLIKQGLLTIKLG